MKKFITLAAAGAVALAVLAVGVSPSSAAPGDWKKWQNNGNWQGGNGNWQGGNQYKKFPGPPQGNQGPQNWQGPPKWVNNGPPPGPPHGPPPNWNNNNNNWWKYKNKPNYPYYPNYNSGIPFVFGLALGATLASPYLYDSGPVYAGYTPHQLWCLKHYPNTYNPRTNTYYVRKGVLAVCVSPYSNPVGIYPY